jgi:hypothetical protein
MTNQTLKTRHNSIIITDQKAVTINHILWQEINIMLGYCLGAFGTMAKSDYTDDKKFIQKKCAEAAAEIEKLLENFKYE